MRWLVLFEEMRLPYLKALKKRESTAIPPYVCLIWSVLQNKKDEDSDGFFCTKKTLNWS